MNRTRTAGRPTFGLALLVVSLLLLPSLPAQQGQRERDKAFVRKLAREMRFLSLAQEEVDRMQQVYKQETDSRHIAELGIEVALIGAKFNPNRESQRTLYKDAIQRCRDLIESDPAGDVADEARVTLADAIQEFGQFLNDEIEIARADNPDAVKGLEDEAATMFRIGVEASDKAMDRLDEERRRGTDAEMRQKDLEYNLTWLRKGVLLREHARAVKADRAYLCERAKQALEELVLTVGEETALGLRGLFEYAQCDEVLGDFGEAAVMYEDTIEQIGNSLDEAEDLGLNVDTQEFLFEMMQEVYDHLTESLFTTGKIDKATELFAKFRAHLKAYGTEGLEEFEIANERFGHMVFLTEARVMAESGEPEKVRAALAMAQRINDKHPQDYVGVQAKAVMKDILKAQRGLVSGKLLFEVAKGEFQNKNYEEALKGLKKALAVMDPEEAALFGLEAYDLIGRGYVLTERNLEGVLALKEGLTRHGTAGGGETSPEDISDLLDMAMRRLRSITGNDPFFERLGAEVATVVAKYGGIDQGKKLFWKNGIQRWSARRFAEAAEEFGKIVAAEGGPEDFLRYELARARLAFSLVLSNDHAAARKAIADYRSWRETKDARIAGNRSDLLQIRTQSAAEIDYCEAYMLYREAGGDAAAGIKKDLTKYPQAIAKLKAFLTNHSRGGANFVPRVHDQLSRLYAESGQMELAEEAYRKLRNADPNGTLLPKLATVIFDTYLTQIENLDKEWRGALEQNKDRTEVSAIAEQLKQARQKLVNLGTEYARMATEPQYGMLANTMFQLDELGDWAKVDEIARRIIELFGDKPEYAERIDLVVRPQVGEALLEQKQFNEAYKMLTAAEKASPNNWELKRLIALALGGWYYFDDRGAPVVVPGLEKPEEAYQKYYVEYGKWAGRPDVAKYSLPWYTFHWEAFWFALQAGKKGDSTHMGYAKALYRKARSIDNFKTLRELGPEGDKLWQMFNSNRP